jgi:lysophospholipase L1-like esterase
MDRGGDDPLTRDFCGADHPFFFSVKVPEGNYRVTVTLGDPQAEAHAVIKAESRRLMVEQVATEHGRIATATFTVNVRTPQIAGGGRVKLKERERDYLHWDDKLTLEFNGFRPCVGGVEVERVEDVTTVYLVGDSTVTDQPREPWNSWGQMLPRWFKANVAVANHAESGESLRSSEHARRFDKVFSTIKPGDYLFIQYGHNDQKEKGPGVGALTTYKADLERLVIRARERGATPVLITPVNRRTFDAGGRITNSLGDYPEAVRRVAGEQNVPLIDVNAMSKAFYEALGPDGSKRAFVDNTHHNNYGSYELARCVVEGIRQNKLPLAAFLTDDAAAPFDPSKPDPVDRFAVPPSPQRDPTKPEGN